MNRTASDTRKLRAKQRTLQATAKQIAAEFSPTPHCEHATVRLLPLDPWHLHAHWQVPASELKALYKSSLPHLNPDAWLLRVYEIGPGESICPDSPWFEVPVQGSRSARDFKIGRDDVAYIAQLGVRIGQDGMHPLATSRETRPPPAPPQTHAQPPQLSEDLEPLSDLPPLPDWRTLDEESFRKLYSFLLPEAWAGAGGLAMNWLVRQRWNEKVIDSRIQATMRAKGYDIDTNSLLTHGHAGSSNLNASSQTNLKPGENT